MRPPSDEPACEHRTTVLVGPAVRVCESCGAAVERLPEPSGCESANCEQP